MTGLRVVLAVALLCAPSCRHPGGEPTSDLCGDLRTGRAPIVGGVDAHDPLVVDLSPGQIRAVGAVIATIPEGYMLCTGTLVGPDVVLTSAHCVPATAEAMEFRAGVDFSSPEHVFAAASWERHPLYDDTAGGAPDHDLAVIRLDGDPVGEGIEPILVHDEYLGILGSDVQAVGFGATGDPDGNSLRWWTVQQVQIELPFARSTSDGGESGLCPGDSGGPMLYTVPGRGVMVMGTASSISDPGCLGASNYSRTDTSVDWLADLVPTGPCGLLTGQGRCEGQTALWCEDGAIASEDCASLGLMCGPDAAGDLRCVHPCGDLTFEGMCEGDTASWCEVDEVLTQDCASMGLRCGAGVDGNARCVEECQALGVTGECQGDTARWCEGGTVRQRDCAACDQACTLAGDPPLAYCE